MGVDRSRMLLVVVCLLAAVTEAEYLKYKDPKQPLNARIKDLMGRMTLEEKIGQMVQIERKLASADVMKNSFIGNPFSPDLTCCHQDPLVFRPDQKGVWNLIRKTLCRECVEWRGKCSSSKSLS